MEASEERGTTHGGSRCVAAPRAGLAGREGGGVPAPLGARSVEVGNVNAWR